MNYVEEKAPRAFFWRRMHSLMGLWLTIFLIEHLFTNSQAALFLGEDGHGFIKMVNDLHDLPFLPIIELVVLGLPILIHTIWGIQYIRTGKPNSSPTDGSTPSLDYPRNKAYTWQRITAWLLIVGIVAHVVQMRFMDYPHSVQRGHEKLYFVRVSLDPGLYTLSQRLGVSLFNEDQVKLEREEVGPKAQNGRKQFFRSAANTFKAFFQKERAAASAKDMNALLQAERLVEQRSWVEALEKRPLSAGEVIAVTPNFGTAELLIVRDTFKMPSMILLYTFFVLAACFHGFNGAWTFLITWGVTLSERSQKLARTFTTSLMVLFSLLGLAAVWLTYWVNLRS